MQKIDRQTIIDSCGVGRVSWTLDLIFTSLDLSTYSFCRSFITAILAATAFVNTGNAVAPNRLHDEIVTSGHPKSIAERDDDRHDKDEDRPKKPEEPKDADLWVNDRFNFTGRDEVLRSPLQKCSM
ncbi:hypothetical protein HYFRA_00012795 [Hymenoscyphus fraxineus]|uniref:Uncharacterized protein n=1 Tax=Hymenoscyphus fraxineus TaxID=746836 RepID=A0A9N9PYD6_9HELO|nr:hypothetical protein HYFRA_00012795 [Hymenoscyphus fraxineus]